MVPQFGGTGTSGQTAVGTEVAQILQYVKQRLPQQMAQYQQPGFEPRNAHEEAMKRMFENMQSVKQRVAERLPKWMKPGFRPRAIRIQLRASIPHGPNPGFKICCANCIRIEIDRRIVL
jgi:hypothetical protein